MTTYLTFPCPSCGEPSAVRISYSRSVGGQYRVRECADCGRFATLQPGGQGEVFQHFMDDKPEPDPLEEVAPLELPPLTPRQVLLERLEHLRLEVIWQRGAATANGLRPAAERNGCYKLDRETAFYQE